MDPEEPSKSKRPSRKAAAGIDYNEKVLQRKNLQEELKKLDAQRKTFKTKKSKSVKKVDSKSKKAKSLREKKPEPIDEPQASQTNSDHADSDLEYVIDEEIREERDQIIADYLFDLIVTDIVTEVVREEDPQFSIVDEPLGEHTLVDETVVSHHSTFTDEAIQAVSEEHVAEQTAVVRDLNTENVEQLQIPAANKTPVKLVDKPDNRSSSLSGEEEVPIHNLQQFRKDLINRSNVIEVSLAENQNIQDSCNQEVVQLDQELAITPIHTPEGVKRAERINRKRSTLKQNKEALISERTQLLDERSQISSVRRTLFKEISIDTSNEPQLSPLENVHKEGGLDFSEISQLDPGLQKSLFESFLSPYMSGARSLASTVSGLTKELFSDVTKVISSEKSINIPEYRDKSLSTNIVIPREEEEANRSISEAEEASNISELESSFPSGKVSSKRLSPKRFKNFFVENQETLFEEDSREHSPILAGLISDDRTTGDRILSSISPDVGNTTPDVVPGNKRLEENRFLEKSQPRIKPTQEILAKYSEIPSTPYRQSKELDFSIEPETPKISTPYSPEEKGLEHFETPGVIASDADSVDQSSLLLGLKDLNFRDESHYQTPKYSKNVSDNSNSDTNSSTSGSYNIPSDNLSGDVIISPKKDHLATTMEEIFWGHEAQYQTKIPSIFIWADSNRNIATVLSNQASNVTGNKNSLSGERDRTYANFRKLILNLTKEVDEVGDADKLFIMLQKLIKMSWKETVYTIALRNLLQDPEEAQTLQADKENRRAFYSLVTSSILSAQTYLFDQGYQKVVLHDTIKVPSQVNPEPIKQHALLIGQTESTATVRSDDQDRLAQVVNDFKEMQMDTGEKGKLPTFSEGAANWLSWWHQFVVMVHDNKKLKTLAKYQKLRESVDGKAKDIIKQFMFCEEHYQKAIDALKEKFGDDQTIARELLRELRKGPNVRKNNAEDYRKLLNQTNLAINYIETYIPDELAHNKMMLGDIKSKLPPDDGALFTDYYINEKEKCQTEEQKKQKDNKIIKIFSEWLEKRTKTLEMHVKMNQGFKSMDEAPEQKPSPGKSPSKSSYRGRYGGKPYSRNLRDDFNFLASDSVTSKPAQNTLQNRNISNNSNRGMGRGRGTRGRGTGNKGRGAVNVRSKNLFAKLPSSTTITPSNILNTANKLLPQMHKPKATVFPNDFRNTTCIICGDKTHRAMNCPLANQYKPTELFRIFQKAEVCTNCLQYGHEALYCSQKPNCNMCKGTHATSIHQLFDKIKFANKQSKNGNS